MSAALDKAQLRQLKSYIEDLLDQYDQEFPDGAQQKLVLQRPFKPKNAGSIPVAPTKMAFKLKCRKCGTPLGPDNDAGTRVACFKCKDFYALARNNNGTFVLLTLDGSRVL